ncbi:MAG: DUF58 domain-containing protein [Oscillospiraceae bacterium]|nr:DUF58 domain-containing protein [Candidatus Equicaccousia limihippi]
MIIAIYFAVLVAALTFFICYVDLLSLILLGIIILVPIVLLLFTAIARVSVSIKATAPQKVFTKGQTPKINLEIKNRGILPVTSIRFALVLNNRFYDFCDTDEVICFAKPLSTNNFEVNIDTEHLGSINVELKKARIYDFFGVFSLPYKFNREFDFTVLPVHEEFNFKIYSNSNVLVDSDVFSPHKPGDDPSEVFQIRDYAGGDKLNRIHWKLSSKLDSFLVKDYSLPLQDSVLIMVETYLAPQNAGGAKLVDAALKAVFSLSHQMLLGKVPHKIGWYGAGNNNLYLCPIEEDDDLYAAFGLLYKTAKYSDIPCLFKPSAEETIGVSRIIYVAPGYGESELQSFDQDIALPCGMTVIDVVENGNDFPSFSSDRFDILCATADGISQYLDDSTL